MKKQTIINLIAQTMAFGINLCISFFLTPFIVEKIGVEANGFVSLANNFIEYAQIITVAINSMAGRFITISLHQQENNKANKYFTSVFICNLVMSIFLSIVSSVVIVFIKDIVNISPEILVDVKILWSFIFANFILSLFTSIYNVSTFVKNRLDLSALCNIKGYLIRIFVLLFCYLILDVHVWYIGLALFLMGIYNLIKNIYYSKKLTPELKIKKIFFDINSILELVKAGIWNTLTKLSSIFSSGLDLLITNIFISGTAMGIMSLSKTIPTVILSLFGTLSSIFAPGITISYAKKNNSHIKSLLNESIKILGIFASIPLSILICFGKEFYSLWAPTQDAILLYNLTLITCANLIFCLPLEPLYNIFTVTNKIKISSIALIIFSSLSIGTTFILLNFLTLNENMKMFIILGTSSFYNIIRVLTFLPIYSAKCLNFKLNSFYRVILINTLSVFLLVILGFSIKAFIVIDTWTKLIFVCIIVCILGLLVNSMIVLTKDDRNYFLNKITFCKGGRK